MSVLCRTSAPGFFFSAFFNAAPTLFDSAEVLRSFTN